MFEYYIVKKSSQFYVQRRVISWLLAEILCISSPVHRQSSHVCFCSLFRVGTERFPPSCGWAWVGRPYLCTSEGNRGLWRFSRTNRFSPLELRCPTLTRSPWRAESWSSKRKWFVQPFLMLKYISWMFTVWLVTTALSNNFTISQ